MDSTTMSPPGVAVRDPESLEKRKTAIRSAGPTKLQVIADFDGTLTRYWIDGRHGQTSNGLLQQGNAGYDAKRQALYEYYHPLEISPTIPIKEKTKLMEECFKDAVATKLFIKSNTGEAVKPHQFKATNDEGMPMYRRSFMRGKLYIHFTVDFPDSLTPDQCKALEAVLPPKPESQMTDMQLDECEETTLNDVNVKEEMRRKQAQAQEAHEEDENDDDDDVRGGAQSVQR